jgi:hypothetical protein
MFKRAVRARLVRAMMAVAVGGSAFQLSGCDPEVRAVLIGGLEDATQSLSSVLITAVFLGLVDEDTTDGLSG